MKPGISVCVMMKEYNHEKRELCSVLFAKPTSGSPVWTLLVSRHQQYRILCFLLCVNHDVFACYIQLCLSSESSVCY